MEKKTFTTEVGGNTLTLEVSSLAEQANAAVIAQYGDTVVLATAVMGDEDGDTDYLPLKVDYEERFYAAGKILGSRFMRREGRASDEAVLAGRLVDRTIRPLFDQRIRRDIQVVLTVLAIDGENDPEFPGLVAASAALAISDIPWNGPVAAARVAKIDDTFVVNPKNSQMKVRPAIDAFAAGPKNLINMIELGGFDADEKEVADALALAQKTINDLIAFQENVVKEIGAQKAEVKLKQEDEALKAKVGEFLAPRLEAALYPHLTRPDKKVMQLDKVEREVRMNALKHELIAMLESEKVTDTELHKNEIEILFEEEADALVHKNVLERDMRPDGRALNEIRALSAETGLFKRTHGSALFVRGNTQALAITTLGAPGSEQLIETMETTGKRRFMLHYNFPPFSVGETGRIGAPGRREIGHGYLAYKAVEPLIPSQDEFPYIVRVVSEILSSNGSSSMATVCASTLSMLDAGVPLKKMAAGIAMGLMANDKGEYKVLTDIQGPEDHYGDMDFKVAGTRDGVNAVQLDVKNSGLTAEMIEHTLAQAKDARLQILDVMEKAISAPKAISQYAPMIAQLQINPEKIGMLIGPGGKVINGLIEHFKLTTIDIEDDGRVFVAADSKEKLDAAVTEIKSLMREFKVGDVVEGKIIKLLEFGAIVDLGGGRDGMVHVSELKEGFVKNVTDVVKLGDFVRAKIVRVEDDRIGLSIKQLKD